MLLSCGPEGINFRGGLNKIPIPCLEGCSSDMRQKVSRSDTERLFVRFQCELVSACAVIEIAKCIPGVCRFGRVSLKLQRPTECGDGFRTGALPNVRQRRAVLRPTAGTIPIRFERTPVFIRRKIVVSQCD